VPREYVPFDDEQIAQEFAQLDSSSPSDAAKLDFCMLRIEETLPHANPSPALVWTFKDGFKELRHIKGQYKGRLFFYEPNVPEGTQDLVMLVVFRKQSQKTPKTEIAKAMSRMIADLEARQKESEN
jgi:phage-related protein